MEPYDAQQMITGKPPKVRPGRGGTGSPAAPRTPQVAMATAWRLDNGCNFLLLLPLSCLRILVLFSEKEAVPLTSTSWTRPPPHAGLSGPFITVSRHRGSVSLCHPIA